MTTLLIVDVVFVIVTAILGTPAHVILTIAAGFVAAITFFGYQTFRYIRLLKAIDGKIKERIAFYNSFYSS